ncbi:hypothetical protein [Maritalea sp. S77]|uniref:hypothetical protein n=1 Tax=Maritalea sp. S77 TaxID=3415125 RepID=UPI003C7DB9F0
MTGECLAEISQTHVDYGTKPTTPHHVTLGLDPRVQALPAQLHRPNHHPSDGKRTPAA